MPIDAGIINTIVPTPNQTPAQAAEAVNTQSAAMDAVRQRIQAARDDAAIRQAFAESGQNADPNEIVKHLMPIAPSAAMKLQGQVAAQQKAMGEGEELKLKNLTTRLTLASQAMQHAQDDPSAYPLAKELTESLTGAQLPDTADPTVIGQIVDQGRKAADTLRAKRDALSAVINAGKNEKSQREAAATAFSLASSPDEWADTASHLYQLGTPKAIIQEFGNWSEDAPRKAALRGMTPEQAATAENQQALRAQAGTNAKNEEAYRAQQLKIAQQNADANTFRAHNPASAGLTQSQTSDVSEAVKGMADHTVPPQLPGRASKEYTALMAEAHRQGVDLAKLNEDWNATQKYIGTLNGAQQTRLRQAIAFTRDSLPNIRTLITQWDSQGLPVLSKANLEAAASGAKGDAAQSLAVRLKGQIADLTSELGTVYKGGNSSTDESLKLAAENLQANWSKKAALDALDQIAQNIATREGSMKFGKPAGVDDNPFDKTPKEPAQAPGGGALSAKSVTVSGVTLTQRADGLWTSPSGGLYQQKPDGSYTRIK